MSARPSQYPLCRHTKTDGRLCQSPARGSSAFCYYHQRHRGTRMVSRDATPMLTPHVLHPLSNARSVQHALSMVLNGLSSGKLRPSRAGKMLFVLQQATVNLHRTNSESGTYR